MGNDALAHVTRLPPLPPPSPLDDEGEGHKLVARYRKARAIVIGLRDLPCGTDVAALTALGATEIGRELAAQGASAVVGRRINTPSATTWKLVVELVKEANA